MNTYSYSEGEHNHSLEVIQTLRSCIPVTNRNRSDSTDIMFTNSLHKPVADSVKTVLALDRC